MESEETAKKYFKEEVNIILADLCLLHHPIIHSSSILERASP
jgi:hypothetical protein